MAASFLQYCCRRKDNNKQSAYPNLFSSIHESTSPSSFTWNNGSIDPTPPADIIPQFSPTQPPSSRPFFRPISQAGYPLSPGYNSDDRADTNIYKNSRGRPYSPAAQSLRQLQLYTAAAAAATTTTTTTRPQLYRSFSANPAPISPASSNNAHRPGFLRSNFNSGLTTPPLSSAGSSASSPPTPFPHNHPSYRSGRPLPPRSQSAACSTSPRSIELVTPHLSASPGTNLKSRAIDGGYRAEGTDLLYEKNWTLPNAGRQAGSLKKLFNFEGMQGRPAIVRVGSSGYPAKGFVSTTEFEMAVTSIPRGEDRIVPAVTCVGRIGGW
ncbi:hypothetical protein FGG08_005236 [Glutinoglossum americanum]|uniref:Uncharacterized protein n=1 Tax=Glutinoglossum americanum TaxID=1670608 RepID=A0A9P8HUV0_9PEZI|nr:hypothetical protein FGG08_005236 [Glutinoglossum americanum]